MIKDLTGADGILKYIIDGERYWPEEALKEALGCKDDDIFGEIKKLREERERYKSNCDYFAGIAQDRLCDRNKLEIELREALGIVDEYADIPGLVRKLKKERDQLKEKCDRMKRQANAAYGTSCGYSSDKTPAFRCEVISYSWNFGAIDTPFPYNSIRVELDLTPTANYKGTFDLEDLKKYIHEYGREKKLGIVESVDYQNAKVARTELAYLYKTVLGKEKLDTDLSPHEVMKAILDAVTKLRDAQFASDQCLRSVYMHVYEGTGYNVSDIYAAPDKLADWIITRYDSTRSLGHMETICDINDCIDELCDKYNVVQPERIKTTRERLDYIFAVLDDYREFDAFRADICEVLGIDADELFGSPRQNDKYILEQVEQLKESAGHDKLFRDSVCDSLDTTTAVSDSYLFKKIEKLKLDHKEIQEKYSRYCLAVGSLLGIPEETRDDINAIERSLNFTKRSYNSLAEFHNNVCEILDIPSSMAYKRILKELHDIADRYDELEDFRADICGALDIDEMIGSPRQNDKYILEQIEKLNGDSTSLDRYARFRSNICTALCLGGETSDEDILKRVRMTKECHDKLCKDYTELRKAIWDAMDRKPETLPDETARLVGEVTELARGEKLLIEFRDDVAKAIGMNYPTTNQVILNNVKYIYKDREDAYGMVSKLNDQVTALEKAKEDLQQMLFDSQKDAQGWTNRCVCLADTQSEMQAFRIHAIEDLKTRGFCFRPEENETLPEIYDKLLKGYEWAYRSYKDQYRLRQCWHARWESENERANGVQKALDREREKCRVKDISLETAKKQYEKVCGNLETAECALNGMKSKVRSLQEEKTKVISAIGQDIWDDAVK